jgi:hypothetical protein
MGIPLILLLRKLFGKSMSSRCREMLFLLFSSVPLCSLPVKNDLGRGCFSEHRAVTAGERKCSPHEHPAFARDNEFRFNLDNFTLLWPQVRKMGASEPAKLRVCISKPLDLLYIVCYPRPLARLYYVMLNCGRVAHDNYQGRLGPESGR